MEVPTLEILTKTFGDYVELFYLLPDKTIPKPTKAKSIGVLMKKKIIKVGTSTFVKYAMHRFLVVLDQVGQTYLIMLQISIKLA